MVEKRSKPRGLGRGLSALMADVADVPSSARELGRSSERVVPIEKLIANPDQPRRRFAQNDLDDLSASIKEKGILQPLLVRAVEDNFEIVAGERRWRAAQMANLHEVPVIVRDYTDTEVLEVAIVENIQRADLNAIEEAAGYKQLMDRFGHTQEKLAEALGKSRSHIANLMRLLALPASVAQDVQEGRLSAGHARALLMADDPVSMAAKVIKGGLSVRATEALVKSEAAGAIAPTKPSVDQGKDADTKALEADLSAALGMKVVLDHKAGKEGGDIKIKYKSLDDLDAICRLLTA